MFSSVRSINIAQQVIDQIREAILKGKLKPGDKLPAEAELAEKFSISRQVLREAVRALEYLGLIDIKKGVAGGIFVAEVDMKVTLASLANFLSFKNVSIEHISQVRKAIEPQCARMAAQKASQKDILALKASIEQCEMLSLQPYSPQIAESEIQFHRVIANTTENPIMILLVDFVENLLQDVKNIIRPDGEFMKLVIGAHSRIYDAIVERSPEKAYAEMLKDVTQVGEYLNRMLGKATDPSRPRGQAGLV